MGFDVLLDDGSTRRIDDVDSYEADGPMTTFFTAHGRNRCLSAWSERVASIRTTKVVWIHRVDAHIPTTADSGRDYPGSGLDLEPVFTP